MLRIYRFHIFSLYFYRVQTISLLFIQEYLPLRVHSNPTLLH
nr:MAG TPA: hypothetical protein [Caudoviricetes sp.]